MKLFAILILTLSATALGQTTQPSISQLLAPVASAADAQLAAANQAAAKAQADLSSVQNLLDAANAALAQRQVLPPNVTPLTAGVDISKQKIAPGAYCFAMGPVSLTAGWQPPANVHLIGNGFPLTIVGAGTGIDCRFGSPNFELSGFAISCPPPCELIEAGPSTFWHDCSIETTFQEGLVARHPVANGTLVSNIVAKKPHGARLVFVVGADNVIVRNCISPGSTGEAVLRVILGDDGHVAQYLTFTGNVFGYANVLQKPTFDVRSAFGALLGGNGPLGEWSRFGEAQGLTAQNILYLGNTHLLGPTGIEPINLMGGSVHADRNILNLTANLQGIAIGGASKLLSADGNTKVSADHKPMKPLGPGTSDGTNTVSKP